MINEKLISTVQYNGQNVGTTELIIEDTSFYPTYTFNLTEVNVNKEVDFNNLQQLCKYRLDFKQNNINPALKFVYVKIKTMDGKFVSQANAVVGGATESVTTLDILAGGKGSLSFNTDYFPSYIGYNAEISFYHDVACTNLIREILLTVLPVSSGGIEIIPKRNMEGLPYYPPFIEMGEDFYVRVNVTGPSVLIGARPVQFKGVVDTQDFSSNPWMPTNPASVVNVSKFLDLETSPAAGRTLYATLSDPSNKDQQSVSVTMGEARVTSSIRYPSFIDGFGWLNTNAKTVKLFRRRADSVDDLKRCIGIVQGSSMGVDTSSRLGPTVITKSLDTWDEVLIEGLVPALGANNSTLYKQSYLGKMGAITWDPAQLTTRESRKQFGKYQKSFTKTVKNNDADTMSVNWSDISDTIADADYGIPATLIGSDLVILIQPHSRADICNTLFNTVGVKEFYIRPLSYNASGATVIYDALVSVLVLRKSEMLNTYPSWIPYPRIIKAGVATGGVLEGEGAWAITIPEGTSIDLREDRYIVQHTHEQTPQNGGNITYSWTNNRIKKEKSKITIFGSSTNTYVDPKHYAIWDLGPDVSFSDVSEGRLRGELKPYNVSPWTTTDLSGPVNANNPTVVVLPTLGESTQFYQSSLILRDVNGAPKQFTVFVRDTSKGVYQGKLGLMVWNTSEMTNADRRNQFGRYQKSMTIPYNSSVGVTTITLDQVNNDVAIASWGILSSLKDPDLMMFINSEEYNENSSTLWKAGEIQIGVNREVGPSFTGKVSVLFMRRAGWVTYNNKAKYPRVIYADIVDIGTASSYTLPMNNQFVVDPMDDRYQVIAQIKPKLANESWITFRYCKLTRSSNNWTINLDGEGIDSNLQIAVVDYGPGAVLFGKGIGVATLTEYAFTDPIPDNGLVTEQNYAFVPLIGSSYYIGGSTNWMVTGLTQRATVRQASNNTLNVVAQGISNDGTWGYGRNSARGYVGWDSYKSIGSILKKQIPNLVARNSEVIGSSGFALSSLSGDLGTTNKVVTDLNKPNLVFAVVPEFADVYFSFKPSVDGARINFVSAYNGSPYTLTGNQRVNTLIVEELKVMPTFAADAQYPRVIFADKSQVVYTAGSLARHSITLTDPSYADVNLKNGRYQILFGCQLGGSTNGRFSFTNDEISGTREWLPSLNGPGSSFASSVKLHVVIVDFGPA